jgi:hypothetical protein
MATRYAESQDPQERQHSQKQILQRAVERLATQLLRIGRGFGTGRESRDSLGSSFLHQEGASSWANEGFMAKDYERPAQHFQQAAIDCYLEDDNPDFRKEVFAYVKKECSGGLDERINEEEEDPHTMRYALSRRAGKTASRPVDRVRATGLNFMSSNELSYRQGELLPYFTYFENRHSGAFGEAEHRGRLKSLCNIKQ